MALPITGLGLAAARQIVEASDEEWPQYFESLRRGKQLSSAVREINKLLEHPEHRRLAIDAFMRIGFWDALAMKDR